MIAVRATQNNQREATVDKPRVLIVDDSKAIRAAVAKVIRSFFDTCEAADGEAGWAEIERDPSIAVVISDLGMPRLDGFGLLQRIRSASSQRIRELPFLVLSGDEDDATRLRARDEGANDFISKKIRGVEAVARIDNLLRLVQAKHDLEASHQALKVDDDEQMWDRHTGAFTAAYLLSEATRHFAYAREHSTPFSAVSLRIDNYAEIEAKFGSAAAGQLLGRLVKLLQGMLRAEDALGRTGAALFSVILPGTVAEQAVAVAQRLRQRLDSARITHGAEAVPILTSLGVAAVGNDNVASVEELLKLTVGRLAPPTAKGEAQRTRAPEGATTTTPGRPANNVAAALLVLEQASAEHPSEVLDRLGPLVKATCARVGIDLQEYLFLLQSKT
jgi:diguanylate cyclase (GGDEF)-like protein